MVRMQIYLTTKEYQSKIQWFACETVKTKSKLVRQAKGLWKDRTDLPDFAAIRREIDEIRKKEATE